MVTFKEFLLQEGIEIFLDDDRDPSDPSVQEDFGARPGMVWVKTVPQAKEYLKTGQVSFISFDNDLGLPEEGRHLANWIESQANLFVQGLGGIPQLQWTVHSKNMSAVRLIIMAMKSADKIWAREPRYE